MQHRHGPAGVDGGIFEVLQRRGHEAPAAQGAVRRIRLHPRAEGGEVLEVEALRGRIEAERRRHLRPAGHELAAERPEGRGPAPAAYEQRPLPGEGEVEAVAEAGEYVEPRAGGQGVERRRPLPAHAHGEREASLVKARDGEGPAQEVPGYLHLRELARDYARAVARKSQPVHAGDELRVLYECEYALFHQSMVEMEMVISSSTSSSTFTVSRLVKIGTLFSTAQRRIS